VDQLKASGLLSPLVDVIPAVILILNQRRQVLYLNALAHAATGDKRVEDYLGLRVGEVFDCVHAVESVEGCGSTSYCQQCGLNFSLESPKSDNAPPFECQIMRRGFSETMDLRVFTTHLTVVEELYIICVGIDIGAKVRHRALERIFFHDLLNATGNIDGLSWLLAESGDQTEQERCRLLLGNACRRLADEVRAHRDILEAERGELEVASEPVAPLEFLQDLVDHYRYHPMARTRRVNMIEPPEPLPALNSDAPLLGRVLGNLIKNALEATRPGNAIEVTVRLSDDRQEIQFVIWNSEPIPAELQKRLFTRAFSTKGAGRGLGTYGSKLIAERYLGAHLHFVSDADRGTCFFLTLPRHDASEPSEQSLVAPA
jgi:signal transduction histidine kinase